MRRLLHILVPVLLLGTVWVNSASAQGSHNEKLAKQANDRVVFYEVLVAELSAQRGELATAVSLMLDAAQRTRSDKLFERTVELAFADRNANSALQAAQSWARLVPESARAHRYVVQILIGLNRVDEIAEPLTQMLRQSSAEERAAHLSALPSYFARTQNRSAAVMAVQQALSADLNTPRSGTSAWTAIARMHAFAGNEAQAVAALQRASAMDGRSDEPALAALQLGKSVARSAQDLIQKRLDNQPGIELRMAAMRSLVELRDYQGAYQQLLALTREAPDYAQAWLVKGSIEAQNQEDALAQQSLQRFLSLDESQTKPSDPTDEPVAMSRSRVEALLLLASLAERRQDYSKAIEYLDSVYSPENQSRVTTRRASILAAQGRIDEARTLLREQLNNGADAQRQRFTAEIQLLRDRNLHQQGFDVAGEAARTFPDEPVWPYEQAMFAEKLGQFGEMERLLRDLIARHPQYHPPYNALGYALADRNLSLNEARALIVKALEFAPDDAYIIDSMGWVEYRLGNLSEARRLLEKAFNSQPDAEIAAHLGEVLWKQGQTDAARAMWKQGQKLNPSNATLLETMRRFQVQP